MLFNSGNPSLLGRVRHYTNDPSTAANNRFSDQNIKDAINVRYIELRDLARVPDSGFTRKVAYDTGVAASAPTDMYYTLPGDFVGQLRVEISTTGQDLSTTMPGSSPSIRILEPIGYDAALDYYYTGDGTESAKYVFLLDRSYGISPPLTATEAGTNSIRITYGASTTALSGDTDEPSLPRPHHDVIALGAAIDLLAGHGLPLGDLAALYADREAKFRRSVWSQIADYEGQIAVAGRKPSSRTSNVGKVRHTTTTTSTT